MSVNFDHIRKKRTAYAITNSVIIAAACFAIIFGAIMLVTKIAGVDISILIHLPISIGAGLLSGATTALLTLKSKKQIARELDKAHSLDERVQTMLAFENDDSYVVKLQREDTQRHIDRLGDNRSFFKQFGVAIISIILSVSILIPAVLVPKASAIENNDPPPTPTVEKFELKKWQSDRLEKLIESVQKANIDNTFKNATVTELSRLLDVLKVTDTLDEMVAEVVSGIVLIDGAAEMTMTYKLIALALFSAKPTTDANTGEVTDPETYKQIKNLSRYIIKLNAIDFGQDIKLVREYFNSDTVITDEKNDQASESKTKDIESKVITVKEKLINFSAELQRVLDDKSIPDGDVIKAHLLAFAKKLSECSGIENGNEMQSLIDKAFDEVSDNICTVLTAQYENKAVRDNVIDTLVLLFEIGKDKLPELLGDTVPTLTDSSNDSGGSNEEGSVSGGYGDGNELFGSNDVIYDPFGKEGASHKLYGEVLNEYYKKIVELLSDESLSEETRQAMAEYFKRLSDGTN